MNRLIIKSIADPKISFEVEVYNQFCKVDWNSMSRHIKSEDRYVVVLVDKALICLISLPAMDEEQPFVTADFVNLNLDLASTNFQLNIEDVVIVNKKVYCLNYTGEVFKIPINLNQPFNESQSLDSDGRKPETKIRDLKMKNVKSVLSISVSQHQEEKEPIIYTALTGDSQCFLAGYSFDTNTPTCSVGFALYDSRTLKRQTSLTYHLKQ